MKMLILRRLALAWVLVLLAWPAVTPWAAENTAVLATTPNEDFKFYPQDDYPNDGTAYHKKTGLTWKRCPEGQTWNWDVGTQAGSCTGIAGTYDWSGALSLATIDGWRLPNKKELNSIVEQRNWNPAINTTVFPNTPAVYFWSASPIAPLARFAWVVGFNDGYDDANGKGNGLAVRLVRGGQYSLLSVVKDGSGSGAVISGLPGIDCGQFCKGSFANEMFTAGQVVLTATPDANFTFGGWTNCPSVSGNQCTVNSANNLTVTATFKGNTTTAITSDDPDPSAVGEAVTVNYAVAVTAPGTGTPTGNVTVSDGTVSCTGTAAAGACNLAFTSAGARTLTAVYAGDTNFNGSTSAGESHTVNKTNTTTAITSDDPDPSAVGQPVTVNFSVAAASAPAAARATQAVIGGPTGGVTVTANLGETCSGTLSGGAGSCTLTFPSAGARTLTATYAGDDNFDTSTSIGEPHTVLARTAQGDGGGGLVTADITGGTCIGYAAGSTQFIAAPTPLPPGITFPYGVFGFTVVCPPEGGKVILFLTYPNPLPPGTQYWKYGPTPGDPAPHWYVLSATITDNTATITITDGGLGDDDLTADGDIEDQGGPGVPGAGNGGSTAIPTLSTWALLLFSALLGLLGSRRPRRHT